MSEEVCVRCNELGEDRRTLFMSCFYDMDELAIPFEHYKCFINTNETIQGYTMRVCKSCRADWLKAIKAWYERPVKRKPVGSGIYVRELGDTIEVTEEEFEEMRSKREDTV